jgi:hypothetical protein
MPGALNVTKRASDRYVENTFDRFAGEFDATLSRRNYRAPQMVMGAAAVLLGESKGDLDVLDAGCGTGLVGSPRGGRLGADRLGRHDVLLRPARGSARRRGEALRAGGGRTRWRLAPPLGRAACPACSGAMRIVAFVTAQQAVRWILAHLDTRDIDVRAGPLAGAAA